MTSTRNSENRSVLCIWQRLNSKFCESSEYESYLKNSRVDFLIKTPGKGRNALMLYNIWHGFFGLFQVTQCTLASCHILICKQEDDSTIRAVGFNKCVTGRISRDENHAVRFRQRAENRSRAWDTHPIRGVSDELARGGASVGIPWLLEEDNLKKSFLWVYVSPSISQLTTNCGPFRE